MRELVVDLDEIASAMDDGLREFHDYYLDTHTGKLILLPEELVARCDGDHADEDDLDDWDREQLAIAKAIDAEAAAAGRRRYEWVPEHESHDAYALMVRFAESVEDTHLRELFAVALDGRGAFRRFRDVLYGYPAERERWFRLKNAEVHDRVTQWLRSLGIEPLPPDRPGATK